MKDPGRLLAVARHAFGPVLRRLPWGQVAVAVVVAAVPVLATVFVDGRTWIGTVTTLRIPLAVVAVGAASWLTSIDDEVARATPVPRFVPHVLAVLAFTPVLVGVVAGLVAPLLDHLDGLGLDGMSLVPMAEQMGLPVVVDVTWELAAMVLVAWVVAMAVQRGLGMGDAGIVAGPVVLAVTAVGTRWPTHLPLLPALLPDPNSVNSDMPVEVVWHSWIVAHDRIVLATVVLAVVLAILVVNQHGISWLRRSFQCRVGDRRGAAAGSGRELSAGPVIEEAS